LTLLSVPFVYPLLYLVSLTFKSRTDYVSRPTSLIPHDWTLSILSEAWGSGDLVGAVLRSLLAVLVGVALTLVVSLPAAYWLHQHRDVRVARFMGGSLIAMMSFPLIAMIVPLFIVVNDFNLIDSVWFLGVVYGAINTPFGIYLLLNYFKTGLDDAILEAATMDGANTMRLLYSIVIPLTRPALATLAALTFIWTWGDLLLAVVLLQDPARQTVMIAISNLAQHREGQDVQLNAAAALICLVPVLLVFAFAQRSIVQGFGAGAVK
jgi:ABC-type glycerol-3-phosphate transport system permease component